MKNFLEIGKIVSVQGLKGEVRVDPWCDSPEFIENFKTLYLDKGDTLLTVAKARAQKNISVIKFVGYDDIDAANTLRGKILYMNKSDVTLPKGSYFIQDLIGMSVIDSADNSIVYGTLCEVSETGANDVYHIKDEKTQKIHLIPAIPQVIQNTDTENGIMTITPLEGLFDDED